MTADSEIPAGALTLPGGIGRSALSFCSHTGRCGYLFVQTIYWIFVGPWRDKTEHRRQVPPLLVQVGNRSFPIIALVSFLIGATLAFQIGDILNRYGQINLVSTIVGITVTRELGPLMAAILLVARVGSAFTAGIGSMALTEETLALQTMGIHPVGFLVAPRMIAIAVMLPILTIYANLVAILGGMLVGSLTYGLDPWVYLNDTTDGVRLADIVSGMIKSVIFGLIITTIACHMGLTVRGGPEGLARNTMLSVVACIVVVIFTDTLFTGFMVRFIL